MDKKTAEKLYEAFYMKVFSYVMTLAKDRNDAEEITQETFFRAISTDKSFRGDSDSYTWLCAIAKNIFIDSKRVTRTRKMRSRKSLQMRIRESRKSSPTGKPHFGSTRYSISWRNRTRKSSS